MRRVHKVCVHLAPVRSSYDTQRQIQDEVEKNLQAPFSSLPESLYELLDLTDLEASSAGQIACRWSHCRLQPDYKKFLEQWNQAALPPGRSTAF